MEKYKATFQGRLYTLSVNENASLSDTVQAKFHPAFADVGLRADENRLSMFGWSLYSRVHFNVDSQLHYAALCCARWHLLDAQDQPIANLNPFVLCHKRMWSFVYVRRLQRWWKAMLMAKLVL